MALLRQSLSQIFPTTRQIERHVPVTCFFFVARVDERFIFKQDKCTPGIRCCFCFFNTSVKCLVECANNGAHGVESTIVSYFYITIFTACQVYIPLLYCQVGYENQRARIPLVVRDKSTTIPQYRYRCYP